MFRLLSDGDYFAVTSLRICSNNFFSDYNRNTIAVVENPTITYPLLS